MKFKKNQKEISVEYYFKQLPASIAESMNHEQKRVVKDLILRMIGRPKKKIIDKRFRIRVLKSFYVVLQVSKDKQEIERNYNFGLLKTWIKKLFGGTSRIGMYGMIMLILGIFIFTLLYTTKSRMGINIFEDKHLKDFAPQRQERIDEERYNEMLRRGVAPNSRQVRNIERKRAIPVNNNRYYMDEGNNGSGIEDMMVFPGQNGGEEDVDRRSGRYKYYDSEYKGQEDERGFDEKYNLDGTSREELRLEGELEGLKLLRAEEDIIRERIEMDRNSEPQTYRTYKSKGRDYNQEMEREEMKIKEGAQESLRIKGADDMRFFYEE